MVDTLRATCVTMTVTVIAGYPILAELMRRMRGKAADADVAATLEPYAGKAGTPTMGGLMILTGALAGAILFGVLADSDLLLPLAVMLVAAMPALFDDFQTLLGSGKLSGHERWFWLLKWGVLV